MMPPEDLFAEFDDVPEAPRRDAGARPSGYEVALWGSSLVLVVGGLAGAWWAIDQSSSGRGGGGEGGGQNASSFVLSQLAFQFSGAAVTAGLFAGVVALAVRALILHARSRQAGAVVASPLASAQSVEATRSGELSGELSSERVGELSGERVGELSGESGDAGVDPRVTGTPVGDERFDLPRRSERRVVDHRPFMRPRKD